MWQWAKGQEKYLTSMLQSMFYAVAPGGDIVDGDQPNSESRHVIISKR